MTIPYSFELHIYTSDFVVLVPEMLPPPPPPPPPGCFLPWTFPLNIEYFNSYVMFRFSTRIFYTGIPGFVTDCPCCIWCRVLTTCLRCADPLLASLIWNDCGFVILTQWTKTSPLSLIMLYIYLMPRNMVIPYFHLPYFYASSSALSLYSALVLPFYMDVVLTLSLYIHRPDSLLTDWATQSEYLVWALVNLLTTLPLLQAIRPLKSFLFDRDAIGIC